MKQSYIGTLLVLLSALGYGLMPILAVYSYQSNVNVFTLLFMRFILAAFFLFVYIFLKKERNFKMNVKHILNFFILGGVCYTLLSILYFLSVKYLPISLAVLILYTYPILVTILSYFLNHDKLTINLVISISTSILGLILVLGTTFSNINFRGAIFAFGASIVYSCYIVLGNKVSREFSPIISTALVTLFTSISMFFIGILTQNIRFDFHPIAWFSIVGIAIFSTVVSILSFFSGMRRLGVVKASIISMTEPVFSIVFSALLFHERLTLNGMVGGLLVLSSAIFSTLYKRNTKDEENK